MTSGHLGWLLVVSSRHTVNMETGDIYLFYFIYLFYLLVGYEFLLILSLLGIEATDVLYWFCFVFFLLLLLFFYFWVFGYRYEF